MLLQSQAGELHLLPALPLAWPRGRVTGLRARGGIEVSIQWANGKLEQASFKTCKSGSHQLRYGSSLKQFQLKSWLALIISSRDFSKPAATSHTQREENDPSSWAEFEGWLKAASVLHLLAHSRLGLMGHYYGGMLDMDPIWSR
jgi:hypothetical protein